MTQNCVNSAQITLGISKNALFTAIQCAVPY